MEREEQGNRKSAIPWIVGLWFIIPQRYNRALLDSFSPKELPANKKTIAMALLGLDD